MENTITDHKLSVSSYLKELIFSYKKQHPRLSSSQLAKRFNLSASCFNRFEHGTIQNPSFESSFKVLIGMQSSDTEIIRFFELFFPELEEFLKEYFQRKQESEIA